MLEAALGTDDLKISNFNRGENALLGLQAEAEVGRFEGRRWELKLMALPGHWEATDVYRLEIQGAALVDLFGNVAESSFVSDLFTWDGSSILLDDTEPRLEEVCHHDGKLVLSFSETVDLAKAAQDIFINGQPATWVADADGFTLELADALANGVHDLSFGFGEFDLAGHSLAAADQDRVFTFSVGQTDSDRLYSRPPPSEVASSTILNPYGFQGLPLDEETGLLYVRNRYYDPEMGRFLTPDPMGYADGPTLYQFALNNPINFRDPTGEIALVDNAIGGVVSVGVGVAVSGLVYGFTGEWDYSWEDAGVDFAAGALTSGLSSLAKVKHLAKLGSKTRYGLLAAADMGIEIGAEYQRARLKGYEATPTQVVTGAFLSFGLGEAGKYGLSKLRRGKQVGPPKNKVHENNTPGGACSIGRVPNCFTAGTEIQTEDGVKPIEDIEIGDRVWARNHISGGKRAGRGHPPLRARGGRAVPRSPPRRSDRNHQRAPVLGRPTGLGRSVGASSRRLPGHQ